MYGEVITVKYSIVIQFYMIIYEKGNHVYYV